MVSAAIAVGPARRIPEQLALAHMTCLTSMPILVFPDLILLGNRPAVCLRPSKR